jgi:hypothetical protein
MRTRSHIFQQYLPKKSFASEAWLENDVRSALQTPLAGNGAKKHRVRMNMIVYLLGKVAVVDQKL